MKKACAILCLSLLSGCIGLTPPKPQEKPVTRFESIYARMEAPRAEITTAASEGPLLTISTAGMPLQAFLRWISDRTQASIICDQTLDQTPVTIDVISTPLADILSAVARRMNVDLTQQGNLYFLGTLRPEDRGVLVRKVRRLGSEECAQAVSVLLSDIGRSAAYTDGLLVVGDRVRVLQRVHSMIDQIEQAESNTWIIQLYLISTQKSFSRDLGVESDVALDMAATFAQSSATSTVTQQAGNMALSAILHTAKTTGRASIIAEPLMLLNDGGTSTFQDGETIPVPRYTTSDSGTVSVSGFDYVESGIIIENTIREVSPNTAKCDLNINLTSVSGYVETSPIVAGQKFSTSAVLESGGVYLLGSMSRRQKSVDTSGPGFSTLWKKQTSEGIIQIWLRCYRIGGPVKEH